MTTHTPSDKRNSLIGNLAHTEFFTNFCRAFAQLTGLQLSIEAATNNEELKGTVTAFSVSGVASTRVPVSVGRTLVATLHTGGVRLAPATGETFAPVAKAMLDSNCSAAEIRAERTVFASLPVCEPASYEAALAMLESFAFQLGEWAHRLVFANAQLEPEPVRRAKAFIMSHLAEPLSLEGVADEVHVSPFHFCKIFKRATGLTFTDYVNRARVEKAKRMLMRPQVTITDVAYDVGFQSLSHFNRCFRRIASESPTGFRVRMRSNRGGTLIAA